MHLHAPAALSCLLRLLRSGICSRLISAHAVLDRRLLVRLLIRAPLLIRLLLIRARLLIGLLLVRMLIRSRLRRIRLILRALIGLLFSLVLRRAASAVEEIIVCRFYRVFQAAQEIAHCHKPNPPVNYRNRADPTRTMVAPWRAARS